MSRYVSFGVLVAVIIFLVIIFFRVMSGFLIPLFLAALLVVIFRPWHDWMLVKCKGRKQIAAILSTALVILTVLVPLLLLFVLAAFEARDVVRDFNGPALVQQVKDARTKLNLDMPAGQEIHSIESSFATMLTDTNVENIELFQQPLFEIQLQAKSLADKHGLKWIEQPESTAEDESNPPTDVEPFDEPSQAESLPELWALFQNRIAALRRLQDQANWSQDGGDEKRQMFHDFQEKLRSTAKSFNQFKTLLLGGRTWAQVKELANPTEAELSEYTQKIADYATGTLFKFGSATTALVFKMGFGLVIMVISLYFFLLEGTDMLEAIKGLSPLDDRHEQELIDEFGRVSRAVVVATLLSALAQGLLGGIGYYFAGLDSIFLLTMLTCCMALVPFFGAASVWIPCSLYLFFVTGNMTAAIGLGIYGAVIVSMADNVIKPLVLHGQSNLHPLLALLSIIGGVTALGPIGILIGPMVVTFLQTLLKILPRELRNFEAREIPGAPT